MGRTDLCKTKYPVLLVHGMGFRDHRVPNYWGRIPRKLNKNGCEVYYGKQDANATIQTNAKMLSKSLDYVLKVSGKEKVNIIAHSKGGLDARYLISSLNRGKNVASLSTINTPHNGSETIDFLLSFPECLVKLTGNIADFVMYLKGDRNAQTSKVYRQLTTSFARYFNEKNPDVEGVYYQSFGFCMNHATGDLFLTIPYLIIKYIENERNDGLLTERAMRWTNFKGMFTSPSSRGISHCDAVDYRRRPFTKNKSPNPYEISDITDFYIELVSNLKKMGF